MSKDTWSCGPVVVLGIQFELSPETPGGDPCAVWIVPDRIAAVEDSPGATPGSWIHLDSGGKFHVRESADSVMNRIGEAHGKLS